jgi:hypothetical protein
MAQVRLGNHAAVVVSLTEQDAVRRFYRDVLGCTLTRSADDKDDFVLGGDFCVAGEGLIVHVEVQPSTGRGDQDGRADLEGLAVADPGDQHGSCGAGNCELCARSTGVAQSKRTELHDKTPLLSAVVDTDVVLTGLATST